MSTGGRIVPEAAARISLEGHPIRFICSGSIPGFRGQMGGYHARLVGWANPGAARCVDLQDRQPIFRLAVTGFTCRPPGVMEYGSLHDRYDVPNVPPATPGGIPGSDTWQVISCLVRLAAMVYVYGTGPG